MWLEGQAIIPADHRSDPETLPRRARGVEHAAFQLHNTPARRGTPAYSNAEEHTLQQNRIKIRSFFEGAKRRTFAIPRLHATTTVSNGGQLDEPSRHAMSIANNRVLRVSNASLTPRYCWFQVISQLLGAVADFCSCCDCEAGLSELLSKHLTTCSIRTLR